MIIRAAPCLFENPRRRIVTLYNVVTFPQLSLVQKADFPGRSQIVPPGVL